MNTIVELNDETFDAALAQAATPALVDFYAPWCGPCRMLSPLLDTLAGRFGDRVRFFKVNVDDAPLLAERFHITGVPTLLLFQDGELRDQLVGVPSSRVLASRLEALAAAQPVGSPTHGSTCCT